MKLRIGMYTIKEIEVDDNLNPINDEYEYSDEIAKKLIEEVIRQIPDIRVYDDDVLTAPQEVNKHYLSCINDEDDETIIEW